jgi:hypothetical protein
MWIVLVFLSDFELRMRDTSMFQALVLFVWATDALASILLLKITRYKQKHLYYVGNTLNKVWN